MPVDPPALLPTNEHPSLRWIGLTGAATALQVARAATQAPGPVLLVTNDAATAAPMRIARLMSARAWCPAMPLRPVT